MYRWCCYRYPLTAIPFHCQGLGRSHCRMALGDDHCEAPAEGCTQTACSIGRAAERYLVDMLYDGTRVQCNSHGVMNSVWHRLYELFLVDRWYMHVIIRLSVSMAKCARIEPSPCMPCCIHTCMMYTWITTNKNSCHNSGRCTRLTESEHVLVLRLYNPYLPPFHPLANTLLASVRLGPLNKQLCEA